MTPTQNRLLGGLIVLIAGGALLYQSASGSVAPDIAGFSLLVFFLLPFGAFLLWRRSQR
ncbi:MAG: hypothetical protein JWL79_2950 [Frankiales bacterium]|nr:hypothetical protein [Frankiales bacterium]